VGSNPGFPLKLFRKIDGRKVLKRQPDGASQTKKIFFTNAKYHQKSNAGKKTFPECRMESYKKESYVLKYLDST